MKAMVALMCENSRLEELRMKCGGGLECISESDDEEIKNQRAHLSHSLDVEMLKMLDQRVTSLTAVFGENGCLRAIANIFTNLYPIFYHCMTLFQMRQKGEDNTSYLERINQTSMEADFDMLDREAFCFTVMVEDDKQRESRGKASLHWKTLLMLPQLN